MYIIYKLLHQGIPIYIGQTTKRLNERLSCHFSKAKKSTKSKIGAKLRKYPREEFSIEMIEVVDAATIDEREQFWISQYNTIEKGCNLAIGGRTNRGMKYGPEYGERISKLRKETPNWLTQQFNGSDEQKKKLIGRKRPDVAARNKIIKSGEKKPWLSELNRQRMVS